LVYGNIGDYLVYRESNAVMTIEQTLQDIQDQILKLMDINDAILHKIDKLSEPDPIYDLEGAAKFLTMSKHTVRKHAREILKEYRTNRKLLFKQSELLQWKENRAKNK